MWGGAIFLHSIKEVVVKTDYITDAKEAVCAIKQQNLSLEGPRSR